MQAYSDPSRQSDPHALPKSKRGVRRQSDAIIRACYRDLDGGTSYGIDWPTLRSTFPDRFIQLQRLREAYPSLPD